MRFPGPRRVLCRTAALLVLLAAGCRELPAPAPPQVTRVTRERAALAVTLDRALDLARAELAAPDGRTALQVWTFTPGAREVLLLEPPPPPGEQRLRLVETGKRTWTVALSVPEFSRDELRVRLELPMGAGPAAEVWLPVAAPATLALTVENGRNAPVEVRLRVRVPAVLAPGPAPGSGSAWTSLEAPDGWTYDTAAHLAAGERVQRRFAVRPDLGAAGQTCTVRAAVEWQEDGALRTLESVVRVRCAAAQELGRFVRITGTRLPADRYGESDPTRRADVIQMPTRLGRLLRRVTGQEALPESGEEAFTYQAVDLENNSGAALSVEVRAWVRAENAGTPAAAFAAPPVSGLTETFVSQATLVPAHGVRRLALPVFVRPAVLPGAYVRRAELRLLGSEAVLSAYDAPLQVEQTDRPPLYVALLAGLITVLALPLLVWRSRAILGRFTNVELIQTALFGAAAFLLAGVPSRLLAVGLNAVLPVLSPFLIGVYSQVVSAAILGALVVLVPRAGVVLLGGGARFLLNGVLFGAFSPADFLYVVPALLASEGVLWAAGITRGKTPGAPRLALAFLGLGVVGAGLELSLEMSLYRLFFADWYIVLFIVLNGALYPALGGALGARLGAALKRTAE